MFPLCWIDGKVSKIGVYGSEEYVWDSGRCVDSWDCFTLNLEIGERGRKLHGIGRGSRGEDYVGVQGSSTWHFKRALNSTHGVLSFKPYCFNIYIISHTFILSSPPSLLSCTLPLLFSSFLFFSLTMLSCPFHLSLIDALGLLSLIK